MHTQTSSPMHRCVITTQCALLCLLLVVLFYGCICACACVLATLLSKCNQLNWQHFYNLMRLRPRRGREWRRRLFATTANRARVLPRAPITRLTAFKLSCLDRCSHSHCPRLIAGIADKQPTLLLLLFAIC